MKIKHLREIKVGIVSIVCLLLLYFGFNFLKGVNIFAPVHAYQGSYPVMNGLTEQAPVYIKGYKVGQVDAIHYDFTRDSAFVVEISVNKDIRLPFGTTMDLIADGLLGGSAIQLTIPVDVEECYEPNSVLPTRVVPGLIDELQSGLMGDLDSTILAAKALVENVNSQLEGEHLQKTLANIDVISSDLKATSRELKQFSVNKLPVISSELDSVLSNLETVTADVRAADLKSTVARVDTAVDQVNLLLSDIRSTDGTIGLLLNDKGLYTNINATVVSADSLLTDLKAHPRRYVHFSLFGGKDKSDKKKKK